jgi:rod shape-determining protein MreC
LFVRGPTPLFRLSFAILVSLLIMSIDHREDHLSAVRSALSSLVYPVRVAIDFPFEVSRWTSETMASRETLLAENGRLRRERLLIQGRLEKYDHLSEENRRLRALLQSSAKVEDHVLIAELINVDMDPFSRRIVLNKGLRHGVVAGQSLIDANGIMGQIANVDPLSSTALLITDPSHALPVQINRTGYRGVAVGTGRPDTLELRHVPNNVDLQVQDLVVTSGLGGRFPPGYPVGRITSIKRDSARAFAHVEIRPSAKLERNREVLLIVPPEAAPTAAEDVVPPTNDISSPKSNARPS